jgi:hypothetical protein
MWGIFSHAFPSVYLLLFLLQIFSPSWCLSFCSLDCFFWRNLISFCVCVCVCVSVQLGFELRALPLESRHATAWAILTVLFCRNFIEDLFFVSRIVPFVLNLKSCCHTQRHLDFLLLFCRSFNNFAFHI